ncbi:M23 family metallopeptidase [Pseudomonas sp. RIT-PI-AD]|uniref:M23 family metallopeptidase n=1 Tax=Pseudomonas sp. RIT-PI-AD TaxID=3035294 RepID=UPI0021D9536D|nr:M23 family metallopeptidase [Pseudomonas sp. RIT-PI-AD]
MHIILLSRRHGATRSLSLDARWLIGAALLALALILAGGIAAGARWFSSQEASEADLDAHAAVNAALRVDARAGREDARRQLDALGAHVAQLQARLTRLDALGERLTELAKLDPDEFDFSHDVGQGGPEELVDAPAFAPTPLMTSLDALAARLDSRERQLQVLEQMLADRRLDEARQLSGWPVLQGYVSSPFGQRSDPLTGRASVHKGIDFAAKAGSDVVAVAAGVVTWSGRKNGYGNLVEISHADGYVSLYAHNQSNKVQVGDLVQRGQTIAEVGRSGRSTGYHVHFEVSKNGQAVNPAGYIARAEAVE